MAISKEDFLRGSIFFIVCETSLPPIGLAPFSNKMAWEFKLYLSLLIVDFAYLPLDNLQAFMIIYLFQVHPTIHSASGNIFPDFEHFFGICFPINLSIV